MVSFVISLDQPFQSVDYSVRTFLRVSNVSNQIFDKVTFRPSLPAKVFVELSEPESLAESHLALMDHFTVAGL